MRVLFYIPVITPWWFENILLPLVETMAREAEVHILVPPLWRNTGITHELLRASYVASEVRWHIIDDPIHPTLRTQPADPQALIDFVGSIDPDYTFCRSADAETPLSFPGAVRHLMESGSPPLPEIGHTIVLQKDLLHHGEIPALAPAERESIDAEFTEVWKRFRHRFNTWQSFGLPREEALSQIGLDPRRKIVALPLEYAHEENFFRIHERYVDTIELLSQLAERLDDETVLAVTDHPLNYRHCDNSAVYRALETLGSKAHLVPNVAGTSHATNMLIKHCDGLVVQNSKSIYSAAYFGKPILRLATQPTASWLNASDDVDVYFDRLKTATAPAPAEADVRTWFGLRNMHDILDPREISMHDMIHRIERPFDPGRLSAGLARFEALERKYL